MYTCEYLFTYNVACEYLFQRVFYNKNMSNIYT